MKDGSFLPENTLLTEMNGDMANELRYGEWEGMKDVAGLGFDNIRIALGLFELYITNRLPFVIRSASRYFSSDESWSSTRSGSYMGAADEGGERGRKG